MKNMLLAVALLLTMALALPGCASTERPGEITLERIETGDRSYYKCRTAPEGVVSLASSKVSKGFLGIHSSETWSFEATAEGKALIVITQCWSGSVNRFWFYSAVVDGEKNIAITELGRANLYYPGVDHQSLEAMDAFQRGLWEYTKNNYEQAAEELTEALTLEPNYGAEARWVRGVAYLFIDDFANAAVDFQAVPPDDLNYEAVQPLLDFVKGLEAGAR